MTSKRLQEIMALAAIAAFGFVSVAAQAPATPQVPPGSQAKQVKPLVPLKITVAIARFQGEKRIGNLPFVLIVNAEGDQATMQMGAEVPTPQTAGPVVSYTYRTIGTTLSCTATSAEDGRFKVNLSVRDNQVFSDALPGAQTGAPSGAPAFQNFSSQASLLLRDGQTIQYNTAVDKASGEQIRVDVTLNVIK